MHGLSISKVYIYPFIAVFSCIESQVGVSRLKQTSVCIEVKHISWDVGV